MSPTPQLCKGKPPWAVGTLHTSLQPRPLAPQRRREKARARRTPHQARTPTPRRRSARPLRARRTPHRTRPPTPRRQSEKQLRAMGERRVASFTRRRWRPRATRSQPRGTARRLPPEPEMEPMPAFFPAVAWLLAAATAQEARPPMSHRRQWSAPAPRRRRRHQPAAWKNPQSVRHPRRQEVGARRTAEPRAAPCSSKCPNGPRWAPLAATGVRPHGPHRGQPSRAPRRRTPLVPARHIHREPRRWRPLLLRYRERPPQPFPLMLRRCQYWHLRRHPQSRQKRPLRLWKRQSQSVPTRS
mmetsp:Transcript_81763/g.227645  ORF Transcript_81763/g.227645 Transcript_81763/m.227645 type:complete len:299 (+) Transcript_81763:493-1389(+)